MQMSKKTDEFMEDVIDLYGCFGLALLIAYLILLSFLILPEKFWEFVMPIFYKILGLE